MLISAKILEPEALDRVRRWGLFGAPVAECPETGMQLRISKRQRTPGELPRYIITAPWHDRRAKIWHLDARTDEEAIEQANTWLTSNNHHKEAPMRTHVVAHEPEDVPADEDPGEPVNWME